MTKIAVLYHTIHGHTEVVAKSILSGAGSVESVQAELIALHAEEVNAGRWKNEETLARLETADGIIMGSPTLMGSASAVMKAFMETAFKPWMAQKWKDKFGSAFTNSASQSGDKLNALIQFAIFGAQMGMIWVPVGDPPGNNWSGGSPKDTNRLGAWLGVMSQSNGDQGPDLAPSEGDRRTAERHGKRFAEIVRQWKGNGQYRTERIVADREDA
ncbi:MAG: flavodoxin family protein [Verrucomicrobia bacterium]|nr:flavodoxin family protein [Verrucomicrobiota bacterium]